MPLDPMCLQTHETCLSDTCVCLMCLSLAPFQRHSQNSNLHCRVVERMGCPGVMMAETPLLKHGRGGASDDDDDHDIMTMC